MTTFLYTDFQFKLLLFILATLLLATLFENSQESENIFQSSRKIIQCFYQNITKKSILDYHYILRLILIFYFILPSIMTIYGLFEFFENISINSWQSTDFLINYEAGFIRRGLLGQVLLLLLVHGLISKNFIFEFILFSSILFILIWTFYILKNCLNMPIIHSYFLSSSPFLVSNFWLNDFQGAGRKDAITLSVFIIFIILLGLIKSVKYRLNFIGAFLFFIYPFLILNHETSFFFLIGSISIIYFAYRENDYPRKIKPFSPRLDSRNTVKLALGKYPVVSICHTFQKRAISEIISLSIVFFPSMAALLACWLFKEASFDQVVLICSSWKIFYKDIDCQEPRASLYALHNIQHFIRNLYNDMLSNPNLYYSLMFTVLFLILIFVGLYAKILALKLSVSNLSSIRIISLIFGILFIPSLPVYLSSIDWGRWLFMNMSIFTIILLNNSLIKAVIHKIHLHYPKIYNWLLVHEKKSMRSNKYVGDICLIICLVSLPFLYLPHSGSLISAKPLLLYLIESKRLF